MQRYSEYKDSGVQWLGEIPSHWEVKPLKHVATYNDEVLLETEKKDRQIKYIEIGDVNNVSGVKKYTEYEFKDAPSRARRITHKGDVIVSTVRTYLKAITSIEDDGFIVSTGFTVLRANKVKKIFLKYYLLSDSFINEVISLSVGTSYPAINSGELVAIKMPVPSACEQENISVYLDEVTSKIDKAIAQQKKMIDLLNERKQIIINNAVTKGLDPNAKMKDSGVEWIGEIPEHWEVRRLKHIFVRIADGTHFSPQIVSEGYPYITATDVDGKVIDYEKVKRISSKDFESLVRAGCKPKMGDILLVKDGATTGRVGMKSDSVDCVLLSSVAMLTPSTRSNGDFLMFMMMSDMLQKQIALSMAGAALPRITLIKLSNFLGVIPPHNEQIEIAEFVEQKINPLKETILTIEQKINLLQERKQIIINDVVTGKVKVV